MVTISASFNAVWMFGTAYDVRLIRRKIRADTT